MDGTLLSGSPKDKDTTAALTLTRVYVYICERLEPLIYPPFADSAAIRRGENKNIGTECHHNPSSCVTCRIHLFK